jgi:hypothetical protein
MIELHAQNMTTILDSISVNITEGGGLYVHFNEHKNLHFVDW